MIVQELIRENVRRSSDEPDNHPPPITRRKKGNDTTGRYTSPTRTLAQQKAEAHDQDDEQSGDPEQTRKPSKGREKKKSTGRAGDGTVHSRGSKKRRRKGQDEAQATSIPGTSDDDGLALYGNEEDEQTDGGDGRASEMRMDLS